MADTTQPPPSTALTVAEPYRGSNLLLSQFVVPLMRGEPVTISRPAEGADVGALVADVMTDDRAHQYLSLELQQRAARMLVHPPLMELRPSDIKLMIAAYQSCWFFHSAVEEGRIWESRLRNIQEETLALLDTIGMPENTGQAVLRHLLLRHLPRLSRTDYHLSFSFFWNDLRFYGTDPDWVKLPGRSNPSIDRQTVSVAQEVQARPVASIYRRTIWLSPITNILSCHQLHPHFTFWGTLGVLAVPQLCRYITSELLHQGLQDFMPALGAGALKTIEDIQESRAHRRYIARFIYNLVLLHANFSDDEELATPTVFAPSSEPRRPQPQRDNAAMDPVRAARESRHKDLHENGLMFIALARALHNMRGPLGASHLLTETELTERLQLFFDTNTVEDSRVRDVEKRLRAALNWPH
ncbi:MAG: hypothetical protein AAFX99_20145 [Myxococcota bacterium]